VSALRALDPDIPLPGTPAIIEDITERKRAEGGPHNAREALSRATRLAMMGEHPLPTRSISRSGRSS
jgi:hypothetical protein